MEDSHEVFLAIISESLA